MAKKAAAKKSTRKSTAKKATAKKASSSPASSSSPQFNVGTIVFAIVILLIGLLGWYILDASQDVNDEYDAADQSNSTLLKDSSDNSEEAAEESEE